MQRVANVSEVCASCGQDLQTQLEQTKLQLGNVLVPFRQILFQRLAYFLPSPKGEETRTDLRCRLGMKKTWLIAPALRKQRCSA